MPDLWGIDDTKIYEYTAGVETGKGSLPSGTDGFNQLGGPFCAWYGGLLYVATRKTADSTINVYTWNPTTGNWTGGTGTETVAHNTTAVLVTASAGCTMIVAEGKLHLFMVSATSTMTRVTYDGSSWSETSHTATGLGTSICAMHHPTYFRGSVYMVLGSPTNANTSDLNSVFGFDVDGSGATQITLTGSRTFGLGLHDNRLFIAECALTAAVPVIKHWDGASLVTATGTGLASHASARPIIFTQNSKLYLMLSNSAGQTYLYESSNRGESVSDVSSTYGAPNFSVEKNLACLIDDTELFDGNPRKIFIIVSDSDLTPQGIVYTWDGTGTGLVLLYSTSNDTGHSINWFQDDIPHIRIDSAADNKNGTADIDYTLFDPNASTCEIDFLFSDDQGGTWARCTDPGTGVSGNHDGTDNLTSSSGGTAHTFVWNHSTDGVPEGSTIILKGIARIT